MSTTEPGDQTPPQSAPNQSDDSEYAPDLVALRDRLAAKGVRIRIPKKGVKWELPEPIEVEGETASEILIRWRHAPP